MFNHRNLQHAKQKDKNGARLIRDMTNNVKMLKREREWQKQRVCTHWERRSRSKCDRLSCWRVWWFNVASLFSSLANQELYIKTVPGCNFKSTILLENLHLKSFLSIIDSYKSFFLKTITKISQFNQLLILLNYFSQKMSVLFFFILYSRKQKFVVGLFSWIC